MPPPCIKYSQFITNKPGQTSSYTPCSNQPDTIILCSPISIKPDCSIAQRRTRPFCFYVSSMALSWTRTEPVLCMVRAWTAMGALLAPQWCFDRLPWRLHVAFVGFHWASMMPSWTPSMPIWGFMDSNVTSTLLPWIPYGCFHGTFTVMHAFSWPFRWLTASARQQETPHLGKPEILIGVPSSTKLELRLLIYLVEFWCTVHH